MGEVIATQRVSTIEYAIRDIVVHANQVAKAGKKIHYLNIGDPVAFDFDTPKHVKLALTRAVQRGENAYTQSEGLPALREAISNKERTVNKVRILPRDVVVTSGISEGIQMVMAALINQNDELLVPEPTYPPYVSYTKFFGGVPVPYEAIEQEDWKPNIDDLRSKVSDRTKGILIVNPSNPCGSLWDEKTLRHILNLAGEYSLPVISDEIYDRIVYDKKFVSTASLTEDVPVIGLNGFSKAYLMTGWRLGYVYFRDQQERLKQLREGIDKQTRIRLCANTPVQRAGVAALNGPQGHIKTLLQKLRIRRDYAWKRMNEIKGVSCSKPEAAFYIFPKIHSVGSTWKTDLDFVLDLLRQTGVLLVQGSGFGSIYGAGHARAVFLPPVETLEQALSLVDRFMTERTKR